MFIYLMFYSILFMVCETLPNPFYAVVIYATLPHYQLGRHIGVCLITLALLLIWLPQMGRTHADGILVCAN